MTFTTYDACLSSIHKIFKVLKLQDTYKLELLINAQMSRWAAAQYLQQSIAEII